MSIDVVLRRLERTIAIVSIACAWAMLPVMIAVRTYEIVARQFISTPGTLLQFVEWRAFTLLVMASFGYAYLRNSHVRIDLLKNRLPPRTQVWIEVIGYLVAIVPVCAVIFWTGAEFARDSFLQAEIEPIAFGLPVRWVVKSFLPGGALLLWLAGTIVFVRNIRFLLQRSDRPGTEPGEFGHA